MLLLEGALLLLYFVQKALLVQLPPVELPVLPALPAPALVLAAMKS
jgi:hypothetical protein